MELEIKIRSLQKGMQNDQPVFLSTVSHCEQQTDVNMSMINKLEEENLQG